MKLINSDNRLGVVEITIPPQTKGPPAHWHEMHDEGFLTSQGTVRYHLPLRENAVADTTTSAGEGQSEAPIGETGRPEKIIDSPVGGWVTVPIRAAHTFSNPFNEEAKFINTFTPAFYINYLKMLSDLIGDGEHVS
jgi:mannose-6-phosphate isomerase-like protein (cupin superfamily)